MQNLAGKVFGQLTVICRSEKSDKFNNRLWECLCTCGATHFARGGTLVEGTTRSCGCAPRGAAPKFGISVRNIPEYHVYAVAQQRCTNPKSQRWASHGGRGIKFLFNSFEEFISHIGRRPSGDYSLERIDNNGNYEEGNVKWATRSEQQLNKRRHGKGYSWKCGKWMVRIRLDGKETYLGVFATEEEAKAEYDKALKNAGKERV
jgi:hypothetical protein